MVTNGTSSPLISASASGYSPTGFDSPGINSKRSSIPEFSSSSSPPPATATSTPFSSATNARSFAAACRWLTRIILLTPIFCKVLISFCTTLAVDSKSLEVSLTVPGLEMVLSDQVTAETTPNRCLVTGSM